MAQALGEIEKAPDISSGALVVAGELIRHPVRIGEAPKKIGIPQSFAVTAGDEAATATVGEFSSQIEHDVPVDHGRPQPDFFIGRDEGNLSVVHSPTTGFSDSGVDFLAYTAMEGSQPVHSHEARQCQTFPLILCSCHWIALLL